MGLSLEEALAAVTINAAYSLGRAGRGGQPRGGQARRPRGAALARACSTCVRVGVPAIRDGGQGRPGGGRATGGRVARERACVLVVEDLVKTYPGHAQDARRRGRARHLVRGASRASSSACSARTAPARARPSAASPRWCGPRAAASLVDGVDVVTRPAEAKRRIAVVPQNRNLDRDLTVREVLTYHGRYFGLPAAEREARADRLLERDAARGQGRRQAARPSPAACSSALMIARALMHDPQGAAARRAHHRPRSAGAPPALGRRCASCTGAASPLILTTHYMEEADRLCQRLAIVDHGQILTLDTPGRAQDVAARRARSSTSGCAAPQPLAPRLAAPARRAARRDGRRPTAPTTGCERLRLFVDPATACSTACCTRCATRGGDLRHVSLHAAQPGGRLHPPHREGAARVTAFLALLRRDLLVASRNAPPAPDGHADPAHPGRARVRQHPAAPAASWPTSSAP